MTDPVGDRAGVIFQYTHADPRNRQELLARNSYIDPPRRALQQLDAKPGLKLLNASRQRRRRYVEHLRGVLKGAALGDDGDGADRFEVDSHAILFSNYCSPYNNYPVNCNLHQVSTAISVNDATKFGRHKIRTLQNSPVSVMANQIDRLRQRLVERSAFLVPGTGNALAARVIADLGFEAVYLSGAGLTNSLLGLPDLAFVSLPELVQNTTAISDVVDLPLIVDADTGFGNAINVRQTVRALERAGANVIQLEDQVSPKKCGHFSGKAVIDSDEMCGKVKAAIEGRRSTDTLIMARTDARAGEGFDAAIARAKQYQAAGADILFVEAPESVEEVAALPKLIAAPLLINIVVGGKTPIVGREELARMGYALVLYANVALQGAITGMQNALRELQSKGQIGESGPVASFKERQRLVGKPMFDELDRRYGLPPRR